MAKKENHAYLGDPVISHARHNYTALSCDQTVEAALETLRNARLANGTASLYVVDEEGKLAGLLPVRRLLTSPPKTRISSIMVAKPVSILKSATMMSACELLMDKRLLSLPIVDEAHKLVGVVDITLFTDQVWFATQHWRDDDVFQMIGVHLALQRNDGAWRGFGRRFRWLLCNIAGGLVCALVASRYESLVSAVTLLAIFIPIVLALAESVSMQSMTITLQTLPRGSAPWSLVLSALNKELLSSAMLGVACGGLVGLLALCWKTNGAASFVIGSSICASIVTACLLGVAIPAVTRALHVDPKVAAGPVILASADIVSLTAYFGLAGWLLD